MQYIVLAMMAMSLYVPTANALTLLDADRKPIGEVLDKIDADYWEAVLVAVQQGTATFLMKFDRQNYSTVYRVEYENEDCTGKAGIATDDQVINFSILWPAAIAPPGRTVYMTRKESNTPLYSMEVRSYWDQEFNRCVSYRSAIVNEFSELSVVGDFSNMFKPPFEIMTPRHQKLGIKPRPFKD
jgi:hypothetical protein